MERKRHPKSFAVVFVIVLSLIGCNPFAPELDFEANSGNSLISDQTTIDGIYQNMKYAYSFKDTLIYGKMLSNDFVFMYRDYDKGFDVSWERNEEMRITNNLFRNCERLDLIWNNIVLSSGYSVTTNQVRSFSLLITFNPTDVVRIDGRVNLAMRKEDGIWTVTKWIDESNF